MSCATPGARSYSHTKVTHFMTKGRLTERPSIYKSRCISRMLSEGGGTRTHDLGIKSPLLYQLSYAPNARRNTSLKYSNPLVQRQPSSPLSRI